jgi:hypothetical protein
VRGGGKAVIVMMAVNTRGRGGGGGGGGGGLLEWTTIHYNHSVVEAVQLAIRSTQYLRILNGL